MHGSETHESERSSPRRERGEKHAQILDAAIDVFAEKGFHKARISDVADRAKVADGTIYLYFRNKEELLLTIFEEKMGQLIDGVKAALAPIPDPLERLRAFARYHLAQVEAQRTIAEVLQVELRLSNKFLKEYRPEKLWEYLNIIILCLQEGQAQGRIRADLDIYIVAWSFFGAMDELAMQWILQRKPRFSLEATSATVAEVFIRGIAIPHVLTDPVSSVEQP